jgi:hypothetical protein
VKEIPSGRTLQYLKSNFERDDLGCTATSFHRIYTEDDVPVMDQYRRIPPNQYQEVKEHLQELLDKGFVCPSKSEEYNWMKDYLSERSVSLGGVLSDPQPVLSGVPQL